jgi:hypothetical protein
LYQVGNAKLQQTAGAGVPCPQAVRPQLRVGKKAGKGGKKARVLRTFGHIGSNNINLTGNAAPLPIDRTVEATFQESEL